MKTSRRNLLLASLGAAQLALLGRFGLRSAFAAPKPTGPTKLLCIWLDGGCNWEHLFAPFTGAGIDKFIQPPEGGNHPFGYSKDQVRNFDGTPADLMDTGSTRKLRGPVFWNDANPSDTTGANPFSGGAQVYRPWGYSWVDPKYKLYERTCVLVGADQGTAAHSSGIVASMSGIAGSTFRAPSVQAVIANHMAQFFPDRPVPNASLGGTAPGAFNLPALATPYSLTSLAMVESTISDRRDSAWNGLRTRNMIDAVGFDGKPGTGPVPLTVTDEMILKAILARKGRSTTGTDAQLQQLYETTLGVSKTVARDVMTILDKTKGFEFLDADPLYGTNSIMSAACIGSADTCGQTRSFEGIGQMLNEMSLTPASSGTGTLLDETLVYIYSDFGRTFAHSGHDGTDHHPATCGILVGGNVNGNQMLGGYDETAQGSPLGGPVALLDDMGAKVTRPPISQDIATTVLRAFGLKPGPDFFISGGGLEFDGAIKPG